MKTIAMVLGPLAHDGQVIVDGVDISSSVRGVEVRAMVGEATHVTLHLIGRVELLADVEQLDCIQPPEEQKQPDPD